MANINSPTGIARGTTPNTEPRSRTAAMKCTGYVRLNVSETFVPLNALTADVTEYILNHLTVPYENGRRNDTNASESSKDDTVPPTGRILALPRTPDTAKVTAIPLDAHDSHAGVSSYGDISSLLIVCVRIYF